MMPRVVDADDEELEETLVVPGICDDDDCSSFLPFKVSKLLLMKLSSLLMLLVSGCGDSVDTFGELGEDVVK